MILRLPLVLALQIGLVAVAQGSHSNPRPTQILDSPDNGQHLAVSVIDPQEAGDLFAELAGRSDIPYGFLLDGSYARAHKMVRLLDGRGVTAAKAWVEGELFVDSQRFGEVGLSYHVAPVVFVREGKTPTAQVLDPSLFDRPVPYATWKARLLAKAKAKLTRAYFTTRFAYDPDDRTKVQTDYDEESLRDMNSTNRDFDRKLFMFDRAAALKSH
ncbi:protein-glutamine glutaminase family protein [Geothrix mesophila]|uniref:protein-glutamine glutaminase family protein n=1 Tax=Geothrix mesophila TaxID=2922723 RepID=UPI001FADA95E